MPAILHAHSDYSVRDSLIRVEELPQIAKAKGWDACALTDHGAIEGTYAFIEACRVHKVKPIVGCEIYVATGDSEKAHHLTVLCKNMKGFSALTTVLSIAHRDHYNARRQRADIPLQLILDKLDDCIILSGCFSSPFWRPSERAMGDLKAFVDRFGEDFYFEFQGLWDWQEQVNLNHSIVRRAKEFNRPLVVTPDCHFGSAEEHTFHDALLAVASRSPLGGPKAWKFSSRLCYVETPEESAKNLVKAGIDADTAKKAIEETSRVAAKVSEWSWDELPIPKIPDVGGNLRLAAEQGLEVKGLGGDPDYRTRLNDELECFTKAGLDRYLLLVRHCLNIFRKEGAEIGPRGSVGGSLVAYCLGITNLDPIQHGLMWQRFYFPGRKGWPDVDIDVDTEFRERLPDVLRREFGAANVAQISNYGAFGVRMAINDAAKTYGQIIENPLSEFELRDLLKLYDNDEDKVPMDQVRTWRELNAKKPDAAQFALKLRGRKRQFGAHAGGFVIAGESLMGGRSAIVSRGKDKALVWDMEVADKLGFVKFDFLGLDSLLAIREIGRSVEINWEKVPLDTPSVYRDLSEGRTAAVPQFLTSGLRSFLERLQPEKFEDLVWATSAFRPGALGQFSPQELAQRYHEDRDSLIVYQEDIMAICVELAGFSWKEADGVRKVVAKKEGKDEWKKLASKFADGCEKQGTIPRDEALALWASLEEFTRYAFNKAHAAAYSWNGYRLAWAKRRYPVQTFAALLNSSKEEKLPGILEEAEDYFGIRVLPPDANRSGLRWTIEPDGIRAPLNFSELIDLRIAKAILKRRDGGLFESKEDFAKRMATIKHNPEIVNLLFDASAGLVRFEHALQNPKKLLSKDLIEDIKSCTQCELRMTCRKVVPPELNRTNILIVGEAPGKDEDKAGRPFVGPSGQLIMELLTKNGVRREDISWSNACHCKPPFVPDEAENASALRKKNEALMFNCPWVYEEINRLKPPLILAVGAKAWRKLGGQGGITKANGTEMNYMGSKVVASLHPAYVLRDPSQKPEIERAIRRFGKLYRALVPKSSKPLLQNSAK